MRNKILGIGLMGLFLGWVAWCLFVVAAWHPDYAYVEAICNNGARDLRSVFVRELTPAQIDTLATRAERELCPTAGVFKSLPRGRF